MQELEPVDIFNFACYPGIKCFNECCKNLSLALTPYDILRMARGLEMKTGEFLEKYTSMHVGMATGLPVVVLKMLPDGSCPFVTERGCSIYANRPTSCRLYPLARVRVGEEVQYYLLKEEFCLGHLEVKKWSPEEWVDDQDAAEYIIMNDLFFQLIAAKNRAERDLGEDEVMEVYMACFDIDDFKGQMGIDDDLEALKRGIELAIEVVEGR